MRKGTKRIILVLSIAVILFACCYILSCLNISQRPVRAELLVNGKVIEDENITIYDHGKLLSNLPILAVLRELGNSIYVQDDGASVIIETKNGEYLLKEGSLYNDNGELVCTVPGYDYSLRGVLCEPGELYVEHEDLIEVLGAMGIPSVKITIDPDTREVLLDYTETRNG